MQHSIALLIAYTSLQEIRVLLRQGEDGQALEVADALKNLPVDQANSAQAENTREGIVTYLSNHPERRDLPHWRDLLRATDISVTIGGKQTLISARMDRCNK